MKYQVVVTDQADTEAEGAYLWILERSPDGAAQWWNGLEVAILSLERMPTRCPFAPENDVFDEEIRQLLYGKRQHRYRILFTVREQTVVILHIRHGVREYLKGEGEAGDCLAL
jgi:plasmid stabilization system protein ParE